MASDRTVEPVSRKPVQQFNGKIELLAFSQRGLRVLRTYELIDNYNFNPVDLEIYTTPNKNKGIIKKANEPLNSEDWHRYVYKLCKSK